MQELYVCPNCSFSHLRRELWEEHKASYDPAKGELPTHGGVVANSSLCPQCHSQMVEEDREDIVTWATPPADFDLLHPATKKTATKRR